MIRIQKKDGNHVIKVVMERETEFVGIDAAIERLKIDISVGLDRLAKLADDYDEVRIDKDGALHCKNLPTTPEEPEITKE